MLPLGVKVGVRMFRFFMFLFVYFGRWGEKAVWAHGISIIGDDAESVSIILHMTCSII